MNVDYNDLRIKMKSERYNVTTLASAVGMTRQHLSSILNNHVDFRQQDILKIIVALKIKQSEIGKYFFRKKVRK